MRRCARPRSGYAMILVMVFVMLLLGLWSVAYRQLGSAVRLRAVGVQQLQRDEGCMQAAARGLALLETGTPATDPYTCVTTVYTSTGVHIYKVQFTLEGTSKWAIRANELPSGESYVSMPSSFSP